tara:strand:+ start:1526 stop:1729 length:204 start_codon:yes stop_codon:yes gene_type:complete
MPSHYKTMKKGMAGMSTMNDKKKTMPGGGKAPMYMMGGKVFEGAQGLMTALAKKHPEDFKKVAEGIK